MFSSSSTVSKTAVEGFVDVILAFWPRLVERCPRYCDWFCADVLPLVVDDGCGLGWISGLCVVVVVDAIVMAESRSEGGANEGSCMLSEPLVRSLTLVPACETFRDNLQEMRR